MDTAETLEFIRNQAAMIADLAVPQNTNKGMRIMIQNLRLKARQIDQEFKRLAEYYQ